VRIFCVYKTNGVIFQEKKGGFVWKCNKCGVMKAQRLFSRDKSNHRGWKYRCKVCSCGDVNGAKIWEKMKNQPEEEKEKKACPEQKNQREI